MVEEVIVNKVAQSGLITIDLEKYFPVGDRLVIDIKDQLYMGLILKEKDFRDYIKATDWNQYKNKNIAITCTADAIVPTWAYMLLATKLSVVADFFVFGDLTVLNTVLYLKALEKINPSDYTDKRVVIKGCGNLPVPESAYVEITRLLMPNVKSLMFGEPCSTVPLYKKS